MSQQEQESRATRNPHRDVSGRRSRAQLAPTGEVWVTVVAVL